MPDDPKYYVVLTETGAKMEARALAEGRAVLLTHVAVGDADLRDVAPVPTATALVHEVCRRPIEYRSVDEQDANVTLIHALIPANIGGFWVRELGVIGKLEFLPGDDAGDTPEFLYAYANHAPYYKMLPQDGQTVTHEITVPILQSTDARLTIVVADQGYVTRPELESLKTWLEGRLGNSVSTANAFAVPSANMLRLSNRLCDVEVGHVFGRFCNTNAASLLGPEGYALGSGRVAPVTVVEEGQEPPERSAVVLTVSDIGKVEDLGII